VQLFLRDAMGSASGGVAAMSGQAHASKEDIDDGRELKAQEKKCGRRRTWKQKGILPVGIFSATATPRLKS
jgi:hypothetical protein